MTGEPIVPAELASRLAQIKLLVLDVDGVLTDGRVYYDDAGGESRVELQAFHARDGLGINLLRSAGVHVAWISGRGCAATRRRAEELGIEELHLRARGGKEPLLRDIQDRLGVTPAETAAMGDDIVDLAMARAADIVACPSDAHDVLAARADFVATRGGGRGAVRDLCDAILSAKGLWGQVLDRF
ncbi:MAG: phenylphosphate carboxylase subunit delta [Planctomycetota bacterium]|jgi:3-deoxy-D-manno-octulosonate 8-phosphate phosphatase (KDO 8-P phosphatase)|nr:phenylphosphate carboxylase subunit delta [Planctomycetota bacterium]